MKNVRQKFKKIDYPNLEEKYMSGEIWTDNWFNLMNNDLNIIDFKRRDTNLYFKNGDFIPNYSDVIFELCGIERPFETFTRVCGEPNTTIQELEDEPRVWAINYDGKFDFLAFITKEYKGSQFEIIRDGKKLIVSPEDFIQWLKDLYFLIRTRGHYISQKISPIDPLGEEWWEDDLKESADVDGYLEFDDLDFEVLTGSRITKDSGVYKASVKFENGYKFLIYKFLNMGDEKFNVSLVNFNDKIVVTGKVFMDKNEVSAYMKEIQSLKTPKRVFNDIDPLGEEFWDDDEIKESNTMVTKFKLFENNKHFSEDDKGKFKIGDRVYCLGEYANINFKGERGTITGFYRSGSLNEIFVKFDNRFNSNLENGDLNQDPSRQSYYVGYGHVHIIDPVKEEEHKKKMEKMRLIHMDVDPYGEDDWYEYESMFKKKIKIGKL